MTQLSRRAAAVVFLAFAFSYFLSALLRAVTATLAPTLTQEFGLSARDLGLLELVVVARAASRAGIASDDAADELFLVNFELDHAIELAAVLRQDRVELLGLLRSRRSQAPSRSARRRLAPRRSRRRPARPRP